MSDRIKGITIEINGDTSKLSTALQKSNKEIKDTQSDLKAVEKLLKFDPSNTELLAQKQKLLADNVANVSAKLDTLKEAEKQAQEQFKKGDISQAQYDALKREIIATEQALAKAEKEAANFNATLAKASAEAKKVSDAAGKIQDKTKGLSAAGAGVVGGLAGMALNSASLADELNTLSKQSGLTTEEIQKFRFASEMVDVSSEDIIGSLGKLKKNMASTSKDTAAAFDKIGVAVTNADGSLRDSTEVFYETLEGLAGIENETERDIVAMQLFGKGAASLTGIIDDGGEALKAYGDQAKENGLILSQDTLDGLNAVNDKIDTLKATITGTVATTGAKALEVFEPLFNWVFEKIDTLLSWIGSIDSSQIQLIATIAGVIAAISPLAGIISKVSGAISGVMDFAPKIISFAANNPVLIIAAAVAALAALIYKNWDKIEPILEAIKEKIKDVFTTVVDWGKAKVNSMIAILNKLISGLNLLIAGLNKINFDIPEWVPLLGGKKFGFNIPQINTLPMLANGGIVGAGGAAIVGERGAEVLTNIGGNAVVTPLTANIDTGAITNAIKAGQGNQNINISFNGSLSQLARVLRPAIVAEGERVGGSFTNV